MNLYEQKWQKFLRRTWLFHFIPFVDFVLAAGSLATGEVDENSDFDVIVGCRQGRIFTARFCCWLVFGLLGWRRGKIDHNESAKDKICFNHFVTPKTYCLSPPYNEYWKNLYKSLAPVYGDPEIIQGFFDANADWVGERRIYIADSRHIYKNKIWIMKIKEYFWGGWLGDLLEKILKKIQIKRIKKGLNSETGHKPRVIFNDDELEFHMDTKRIDSFLQKLR